MGLQTQIIIVLFSLMAGAAAVVLANRLMKKYTLPYLSSYFYFLIFIFIFAVYSIVGSQSVQLILNNQDISPEAKQSISAILLALGIPFLILAWYMLMRLGHEMFKSELSQLFVALYFGLFALSFIGFILMNADIGGLELINFFMDTRQLTYSYSGLMLAVFGYVLIVIFTRLRSLKDVNQRIAYRWFAIWYAGITVFNIVSLQLTHLHVIPGLIFIASLTGFNLAPVLFLQIYLERYYVESVEDQSFGSRMDEMIKKYDISKREAEIVELICKGMTNKEISESLFISVQTVKDHIYRIFLKTGVKNRVQLTNLIE